MGLNNVLQCVSVCIRALRNPDNNSDLLSSNILLYTLNFDEQLHIILAEVYSRNVYYCYKYCHLQPDRSKFSQSSEYKSPQINVATFPRTHQSRLCKRQLFRGSRPPVEVRCQDVTMEIFPFHHISRWMRHIHNWNSHIGPLGTIPACVTGITTGAIYRVGVRGILLNMLWARSMQFNVIQKSRSLMLLINLFHI